jgi:hypothetical protein
MSAHEFLTDQGAYTHYHVPAEFDDGDPENGPGTVGFDEVDVYEGDSHIIILRRGIIIDLVPRDWEFEVFIEEMERQAME